MDQFSNFNSAYQALENSGMLDNRFTQRPPPAASSWGFTQARSVYSQGLDPLGASFLPAVQSAPRQTFNIVLGNGVETQALLMLFAKVDRMASEIQAMKHSLETLNERQDQYHQELMEMVRCLKEIADKITTTLQGDTPCAYKKN